MWIWYRVWWSLTRISVYSGIQWSWLSASNIVFVRSCQSSCCSVTAAIFWQHHVLWQMSHLLNYDWSCCLGRFYMSKLYLDWNFIDHMDNTDSSSFSICVWRVRCVVFQSICSYQRCKPVSMFITLTVGAERNSKVSCCCLVKCRLSCYRRLRSVYHLHHWKDEQGKNLPTQCHIYPVTCVKGQ
mgnify:CR=1 FL=1